MTAARWKRASTSAPPERRLSRQRWPRLLIRRRAGSDRHQWRFDRIRSVAVLAAGLGRKGRYCGRAADCTAALKRRPVSGKSINFQVRLGSGTPSPATATPDANGYARSTLHLSSLNADVQGSACLAPANNQCQTFYVVSVAPSLLKLENVSGSNQ